jgi:hypothetical protein
MSGRLPKPPGRPLLPPLAAVIASVLVCVTAMLPWYEPDLAEPLAPNSVSGWDATLAARIAVAGAVLCGLAALAVALDARDLIALEPGGITLLSMVAVAGSAVACAAIGFRAIRPPDPVEVLSRELGLYLAVLAALAALGASLIQLVISSTGSVETRRRTRAPWA